MSDSDHLTFHPFGRLPTEIRLKIWLYSFPTPSSKPFLRISTLTFFDTYPVQKIRHKFFPPPSTLFHKYPHETPEHDASIFIPFLQACVESRDLYLKTFNLTHSLDIVGLYHEGGRVWYSPSQTILYLQNGCFFPTPQVISAFRAFFLRDVPLPLLPDWFAVIVNLGLPESHFNSEITNAFRCRQIRALTPFHWERFNSDSLGQLPDVVLSFPDPGKPIPKLGDSHDWYGGEAIGFDLHTVKIIGGLFSSLKSLKKLYLVRRVKASRLSNTSRQYFEHLVIKMQDLLWAYERELKTGRIVRKGLTGWKAPKVEVWYDEDEIRRIRRNESVNE